LSTVGGKRLLRFSDLGNDRAIKTPLPSTAKRMAVAAVGKAQWKGLRWHCSTDLPIPQVPLLYVLGISVLTLWGAIPIVRGLIAHPENGVNTPLQAVKGNC